MAGYRKGSQAWYDHARKRVVELSKLLSSSSNLTREEKDKIYNGEYMRLICDLDDYWNENLINNPL